MGSNQSSHADITHQDNPNSSSNSSVRGRKATSSSNNNSKDAMVVAVRKEFGNDPTETTDRMEEDFLHSDEEIEVPFAVMEVDEEEEDDEEDSEEEEEDEGTIWCIL